MDIRCNSCGTEYEFDDAQIPAEGVRVKCEVCQNIFQVIAPEDEAGDEQVFMIRQVDGNILEFTELETLHEWILEGVVVGDDEISSSGDSWAKLKYLPELEEVFAQVPGAEPPVTDAGIKERGSQNEPKEPDFSDGEPTGRISSSAQASLDEDQDPKGELKDIVSADDEHEPDFGDDLLPVDLEDVYDEHFMPVRKKAKWPWILGFFVLVMGGSLGGLFYLEVLPNPFVKGAKGGTVSHEKAGINEDSYLKNSMALMVGGTKQDYAASYKALDGCASARCFAQNALLHAMTGFTYFIEMRISEQRAAAFKKESREYRNWAARKRIFEKGIRDEVVEAAALSENSKQLGNARPWSDIALLLTELVQSKQVSTEQLAALAKQAPSNPYIPWLQAMSSVIGKDWSGARKALSRLGALDTQKQLLIPSLTLGAFVELADNKPEKAQSLFATICQKRPRLKLYCENAKEAVASKPVETPPKPDDMGKHPIKSMKTADPKTEPAESGDYDYFFMKAQQAYKLGDKSKARDYYLRAAKKDATSADPLNGVGWCYLDGGNFSKAILYFKKALALVPYYGRARYGLAEAYARSGNKKAALAEYKNYISRHAAGRHAPRVKMQIKKLEAVLNPVEPEMNPPMVIIIPMKDPDPPMGSGNTTPAMAAPTMGAPMKASDGSSNGMGTTPPVKPKKPESKPKEKPPVKPAAMDSTKPATKPAT